jgi:hypothetical protein
MGYGIRVSDLLLLCETRRSCKGEDHVPQDKKKYFENWGGRKEENIAADQEQTAVMPNSEKSSRLVHAFEETACQPIADFPRTSFIGISREFVAFCLGTRCE